MHGRLIAREIQPNASFVMEHAQAISALAEPKGVLGRIGTMEVRLARNSAEIAAAQAVRFRVFYEELGAKRAQVHDLEQRDADRFDMICDHLLVIDTSIAGPENQQIVGTYRLLRQERALAGGGFYTSGEFDSRMEANFAAEFHEKFGDQRGQWLLTREDEVILLGDTVMIPDFALTHKKDGRRALIEIVGFWHPEYLERKIAKAKAANRRDLILLVYEGVNLGKERLQDVPAQVLYFKNKPVLKEVMEVVEQVAV